jgi:hypothetical protein
MNRRLEAVPANDRADKKEKRATVTGKRRRFTSAICLLEGYRSAVRFGWNGSEIKRFKPIAKVHHNRLRSSEGPNAELRSHSRKKQWGGEENR